MDIFALLGMLLTVAAILALAYYCTKYLSRMKFGTFGSMQRNRHMQTLDQLPVGADLRLMLVQVGTRYLLLGVAPGGITTLAELTPEEATLWELDNSTNLSTQADHPSFRESFLEALKQKRK